jgi:hypothetical protein
MKMAQRGAAETSFPPRTKWHARVRAGWRTLSTVERIAWIIAVALVIFGLEIGGLFTITSNDKGFAYILNRFTGGVSLCTTIGCKDL